MYKIVKTGGDGHDINYREIIIERVADVSDLPNSKSPLPNTAEIGSIAYLQDMSKTYLLGPDDVWREV